MAHLFNIQNDCCFPLKLIIELVDSSSEEGTEWELWSDLQI